MRVSVRVSYVTPEKKNTGGMKGLLKIVLSVEDGDMKHKLQDILRIVKQRGESRRLKPMTFFTRPPQPAKTACPPSEVRQKHFPADGSKQSCNEATGEK